MSIEVSWLNEQQLRRKLGDTPKAINKVIASAANYAARSAKTSMAKVSREEYTVQSTAAKATIHVKKAGAKNPVATVSAAGKKINESYFRTSPTAPQPKAPPKKGYRVKIRKDSTYKPVIRGFLTVSRGDEVLFQRDEGAGRFPLKRLMGPSVPEMIGQRKNIKRIESATKTIFNERIQHDLQRALEAQK